MEDFFENSDWEGVKFLFVHCVAIERNENERLGVGVRGGVSGDSMLQLQQRREITVILCNLDILTG